MVTDKDRRYILDQFLRAIFYLSDRDAQQRAWINAEGPEAIDYDETVNFFFDFLVMIFEEIEKYRLTKHQIKLIKNLEIEFENFSDKTDSYWPPNFIDTPEWEQVRQKAKLVLEAFNYQHKPFVPVSDAKKAQASDDS